MPNRELQFELSSADGTKRSVAVRFTQVANLELEKAGITEDEFFDKIKTPSLLEKSLVAALEGARLKRNPKELPNPDDALVTAREIIDELGRLPVRVRLGEAYNLAAGVQDIKSDEPAPGGPSEGPKG